MYEYEFLVNIGYGEERKNRVEWLKEHGYEGAISEDYKYSVIFIKYNYFYAGNVTCFAAMTSQGKKVISWEKLLIERELNKRYC
jgi:hypothetical protein